jgi:hypothetical protein
MVGSFNILIDEYEVEKAKLFNTFNKKLDIFNIFSVNDFETLINSGDIEMPLNSELTLRILKDYSKIDWFIKNINGNIQYYHL